MKKIKKIKNDNILERRFELINKYYKVDQKEKIVHFNFHYENIHEILDENVSNVKQPRIKTEVLEDIGEKLSYIPKGYHAKFHFEIDEYDGYDPKIIQESLNDCMEGLHYEYSDDNTHKWLKMMFLWFTGIGVLLLLLILDKFVLNTSGPKQTVLHEFVDIIAWAFIWEGVTVMFLTPAMFKFAKRSNIEKIDHIYFLNKEKEVVAHESHAQMISLWEDETKIISTLKIFLLIISGIMISSSAISLVSEALNTFTAFSWVGLITFGVYVLISLFKTLAGLGGFFVVIGSRRLSRVSLVYGYIGAVLDLATVVLLCFVLKKETAALFVAQILSTLINVAYIIMMYLIRPKKGHAIDE